MFLRGHSALTAGQLRDEGRYILPASREQEAAEGEAQCALLRELLDNPFRPVVLPSGWRSTNVVGLAGSIYEECRWDLLPILADALEDAGCPGVWGHFAPHAAQAAVLEHCRRPGEHIRGCCMVDLLLGKS